ncbi:MAG: hypothetical protein JKY48_05495 [Flavobacteriales bacterium]|nr:hypothetical protein [Flavobacteriales bacterium]
MSIKQSMEENKHHILESLPTQELKDAFIADLDKVEELVAPSVEELVKEAQSAEHVGEEMYDSIKKEIETGYTEVKMSAEEEKAAIEEELKNPPKGEDA